MTTTSKQYYFLTGDIGGTNSRMAFYSAINADANKPLLEHTYRNQESIPDGNNLTETTYQNSIIVPFVQKVFKETNIDSNSSDIIIIACLACAGPVVNNRVIMSNIKKSVDESKEGKSCPVIIDGNLIESLLTIPINNNNNTTRYIKIKKCIIINDFVAQGYGCLTLQSNEVKHLYGPELKSLAKNSTTKKIVDDENNGGPKVCVGAGTGLGECYLTPDNNNIYTCFASEGGHVDYTPKCNIDKSKEEKEKDNNDLWKMLTTDSTTDDDETVGLWKFLCRKYNYSNRISVERIVSGLGLANVYEYLSTKYPNKVNDVIHKEYLNAQDMQAKVIAENYDNNELCQTSMNIMMSTYGSEVGNAAIKFIPTGGLFVTGGLTPKNIQHITGNNSHFITSYKNKGRATIVLEQIPTYAVMVEDLGVRGVLQCAQMEYNRYIEKEEGDDNKKNRSTDSTCSSSGCSVEKYITIPKDLPSITTTTIAFVAGLFMSQTLLNKRK